MCKGAGACDTSDSAWVLEGPAAYEVGEKPAAAEFCRFTIEQGETWQWMSRCLEGQRHEGRQWSPFGC